MSGYTATKTTTGRLLRSAIERIAGSAAWNLEIILLVWLVFTISLLVLAMTR